MINPIKKITRNEVVFKHSYATVLYCFIDGTIISSIKGNIQKHVLITGILYFNAFDIQNLF